MADYLILEPDTVADYLREHGHADGELDVREVSDGNMNRVFVASTPDGERSLAVKQALPWIRVIGPSAPMSPHRADAEARAYSYLAQVAPEETPTVYEYDGDNFALVMEDLSDLRVLRDALNDGAPYGDTSVHVGSYVANLTFATSDFGMPSAERKALVAASVSPELCQVTEDFVLSQPYLEHEHNHHHPGLGDLVAEVRADPAVHTAVSALRHRFMYAAEALLHGDLHSGSVMVGERDGQPVTRVFDPEFSFVGPIGFDLGLYWANAVIAAARARALGAYGRSADHLGQLRRSWDTFQATWWQLWPGRVDRFFTDEYAHAFLASVWGDGLGFAGTEICRRVIGYSHAADLTTLPDPVPASGWCLRLARELLVDRHSLPAPADVESLFTSLTGKVIT